MSVRLSSLAAERRLSGMRSNTPDPSAEVRSGSPGAPAQASKFATVLVRTRTQRRPSTTTMFSNSPNPFAGPDGGASAVAKEAMGGKGSPFKDAPAESTAAPSIVMRDDQSEPARELEMLAQFRAREVTLAKARTAQHPFRYMGSASPGVGDARSTEGVRLAPAEWEAQFASYTDWELEMLQKLGKVAAIMLGNDSLSSREKEARLDMVAAEELVKKPRMSRSPSAEDTSNADVLTSTRAEAEVLAALAARQERRRSPRSPESKRKTNNFQSLTAKVAAVKRRSLERKKGLDTLTQLRESGEFEHLESSGEKTSPSPLFTLFNGPQGSSANNSPAPSPMLTRKPSSNAVDAAGSTPNTPPSQRRSGRFGSVTIRPKRASVGLGLNRTKDEGGGEDEGPAFPGLSMRSGDAKDFLELKKAEEQKKALRSAQESGVSSPEAESDASPESPEPPAGSRSPPITTPVAGDRTSSSFAPLSVPTESGTPGTPPKLDLTSKLGLRRASGALAAAPSPGHKQPLSPKQNKRFSAVFGRKSETVTEAAKPHDLQTVSPSPTPAQAGQVSPARHRTSAVLSAPNTPVSPRSARSQTVSTSKSKSPSPRGAGTPTAAPARPSIQLPSFARRRATSPRSGGTDASPRDAAASPPPSVRELVADGATLEALNNLLDESN